MGQTKSKNLRETCFSLSFNNDSLESKHSVPTGLYPTCNWPDKLVKKLVCDKKLSPIFKGVAECTTGEEMDECPICFLVSIKFLTSFSCFY